MDIFRSSDDYEVLVAIVREASAATGMDVNGYVFMRNHFHIVVTPQQTTAVEKAMHAIGFKYARYINNRYKRTGAVFEGRYRSTIIDTERYWYLCMRYVELNPVRAGFVSTPHAYYWSSYATHASGSPDALVTLHPQYLALGRTPRERQECWRRHCADAFQPGELETIRKAVHGGGVLGALVIPDEDI
jgi:putative transposase